MNGRERCRISVPALPLTIHIHLDRASVASFADWRLTFWKEVTLLPRLSDPRSRLTADRHGHIYFAGEPEHGSHLGQMKRLKHQ